MLQDTSDLITMTVKETLGAIESENCDARNRFSRDAQSEGVYDGQRSQSRIVTRYRKL